MIANQAERIDQARAACQSADNAIRAARFAERARIVAFLGYALPDTEETREAIADVFSGEHHRKETREAIADVFGIDDV